MKKIFLLLFVFPFLFSCGGESNSEEERGAKSNSEEEKCTDTHKTTYENGNVKEYWCWRREEGKIIYLAIKEYYQNGQIKEETIIDCSKTHYVSEKWYEDGKMEKQVYFLTPTHHQEDGKMKNRRIKDGYYREWYEEGMLKEELTFENDALVYVKRWDRTGELKHDYAKSIKKN